MRVSVSVRVRVRVRIRVRVRVTSRSDCVSSNLAATCDWSTSTLVVCRCE
jgi:hypothetical protein